MNIVQQLTQAQLFAALGWAIVAIGTLAKLFKDWKDVVAAVKRAYKGVGLVWKWIISSAIRRKEVNDKLDFIVHELSYNSGSSVKDALHRIESAQRAAHVAQEANNIRMRISEVANERMVFACDADGCCTEINEVFLKRFGYVEGDVLEYAFENLVHEEDVNEMRQKWQRAINTKGKMIDEQRIYNSRKEVVRCCVRANPIIINEELKGFIGYIEILK